MRAVRWPRTLLLQTLHRRTRVHRRSVDVRGFAVVLEPWYQLQTARTKTSSVTPPPLPLVQPKCRIPEEVVTDMVSAGAVIEGSVSSLHSLRMDGVHTDAWKVYESWVMSLKKVDAKVDAESIAPAKMRRQINAGKKPFASQLQDEANSIIRHFAPLPDDMNDDEVATLLASLEPYFLPPMPVNTRHPKVAVDTMLRAISNPGPTFREIHSLKSGDYICQVVYMWRSSCVVVPIFRK